MKTPTSFNNLRKIIILLCIIIAFLAGQPIKADNTNVKINRVALFKNGLGYFSSSVTIPKEKTNVNIGQFPISSLGTFWVSYPQNLEIKSLVTKLDDVYETRPVRNLSELLNANTGKYVTVKIGSDDNVSSFLDGKILKVIPDEKKPKAPNPYFMDVRNLNSDNRHRSYYQYIKPNSDLIFLEKKNYGIITLKSSSISRVNFPSNDFATTVPVKSKQSSINVKLKEPADENSDININYLARGITWSPSYLIDISDPKTAKLSAKALVINEVIDMNNVHLDLITGFPNVKFAEVNSPIAMSEKLDKFLNALTKGRSESRNRNYMMTQQAMTANVATYAEFGNTSMPEYSTARKGDVSEDLFFYPVDNISLACGETAYIPLFTADLPYKHIYIWNIPDFLDKYSRYQNNNSDIKQKTAQKVWHCCRITNNMKMPWTTAAAEFVKNGQFVGQDVCFYTAPGAETTIQINRAMNVIADENELEVERKRNAASFYGSTYDLVKVKGELKIKNRLNKNINIEITKNLSGNVLSTETKAKDVPTAKGLKQVNTRHKLIWNIELKAGAEQTLTYIYDVYVR